jgi:hypothetical protein
MKPNVGRTILGGFVGTFAITFLMQRVTSARRRLSGKTDLGAFPWRELC